MTADSTGGGEARGEGLPAFYALTRGGWRDYVTLLHLPYTLWHLGYVALGAAVSSAFYCDRTLKALAAFALALGVAAHALDEYRGRPLRSAIPDSVLLAMAAVSLTGAAALGIHGALTISPTILPWVAVGVFLVVAYNLELFGGRFHTDAWFALAWGTFPALVGHWANALRLEPAGLAVAAAAYFLSRAQRTLSLRARQLRRQARSVEGTVERHDGTSEPITVEYLRSPVEQALRALSYAVPLLAAGALLARASL
ncbi:MAG: hypothetical protein QN135_09110 [Armatimonadota bacterium]|nr:hypothetical protein [Armatimonadota bacterium]